MVICFAKPYHTLTSQQVYRQKYSNQLRTNKHLADYFNKVYKNARFIRDIPVTKSFNLAKRTVQTNFNKKAKIYVKKWKGTHEIVSTTQRYSKGKKIGKLKSSYLARKGLLGFKKRFSKKRLR